MIRWAHIRKILLLATVSPLFALVSLSQAQQPSSSAAEVPLTFQYRGVVNVYINAYYQDDQFYLPVSELFNALNIQYEVDQGALTISGIYLGETEYMIDFKNQVARAGDTEIQLQAEDFLIPEIDYYVKPSVLDELFGLVFTTNFNNLTLDLETEDQMPVIAQYEREQERKQLDRERPIYDQTFYPLRYDREYGTVDGAFLDYNISAIYNNSSSALLTFSNALGMEFIGGDVQGNLYGAYSQQQQSFTTSGLRWRYVQRDNNYFSSAIVGQTNSEGLGNRSIRGVKISNKPVEPRRLFDQYVIDGNTTPQSEVELYLNNNLIDFQEANETGNYRFVVPLTYGSTDYTLRIYTPSGRSIERSSRIQIPFDYLPKGEIDYTVSGGELTTPLLGTIDGGYIGAATVSAGLSNWLTAQASTEYLTKYHSTIPSFTGTLNARLFNNYLISANINSENYYQFSSNVVYSSGASWNLTYEYNAGDSRLYNTGNSDHQTRLNLFTPLRIGNIPFNIRWSSTYQQNQASKLLRYRADLSTRIGRRMNVRLGYRDQQAGDLSLVSTSASRLTNSYTYSVSRRTSIPALFRGMFVRAQLSYLPGLNEFEEAEFQLSRDLRRTGRFQLRFGHNFIGDFNTIGLNVTIDFNKVRSNTSLTSNNSQMSLTQNIRGSIGYDPHGDQLLLNNRQQVGQSGAAVRLFVDQNNDGHYQEESDQVITDPAVRLNRSGGRTMVKNGINYISQLQPYYRYDIEINKRAISNPLLVPDVENFSIVTDPNQYKTIEIPFYQSGVISGRVDRLHVQGKDSTTSGISGVRLFLESNYEDTLSRDPFSKELRTFSDGSFYDYEIPPGKYNLFIDPNQLQFLNGVVQPDTMSIEIEALPQGDFIENLRFLVISEAGTSDTSTTKEQVANKVQDSLKYKIQLVSFRNYDNATQSADEVGNNFNRSFITQLNKNTDLYAVRSEPFRGLQNVISLLTDIQNRYVRYNPGLILLESGRERLSIQLAAFSSQSNAEEYIKSNSDNIKSELFYFYDHREQLYKIQTGPFNNKSIAQDLLLSLKDQKNYHDAYILNDNNLIFEGDSYTYEIWITGVSDRSQISIPSRIQDIQIRSGQLDQSLVITSIPTWSEAIKLQGELKENNSNFMPFIVINVGK